MTTTPTTRANLFLDPSDDPRSGGTSLGDERATLLEYLRFQRLTLEIKCAGLDAEQLARRSVPPSTMSLLGLVRHLAHVEHVWFRIRMDRQDVPKLWGKDAEPDADFDGAVADEAVVAEAWEALRREQEFADAFLAAAPDLDVTCALSGEARLSLRELLVHMIEEYARHNGHADLLRELVDGRIGE